MTQYRVELKNATNNWEDWADYNFNVFAKTEKEAWDKAVTLEDAWNIERIYPIKFIG